MSDKQPDVKPERSEVERQPVVVRGDGQIHQIAWNPDGKSLATIERILELVYFKDKAGNDTGTGAVFPSSTVNLRDAKTGKVSRMLADEKHTNIMALAFSPDGKTLAYSVARQHQEPREGKSEVRLVDIRTGALKHKIDLLNGSGASALAFSPDGARLAIGGGCLLLKHRTFLKLWDVQNRKLIGGTKDELKTENDPLPEKGQVFCLAFSSDGRKLAAGDQDGSVRVFDGVTCVLTRLIEAHDHWLIGVGFGPDDKTLVSAADRLIKIWHVETGELLETSVNNDGTAFAMSSDGQVLATAGITKKDDRPMLETIVWHAWTDIPIAPRLYRVKEPFRHELLPPAFPVTSFAISPDRSTLAVGLSNNVLVGARTQEIKVCGELRLLRFNQLAAQEDGPKLLRRLGALPAEYVKADKNDNEIITGLFRAALDRAPGQAEYGAAAKRLQGAKDRTAAGRDILWALVNSREFLQRHRLDNDVAATLRMLNDFAAEWEGKKPRKP